jgi:hypothetical protein
MLLQRRKSKLGVIKGYISSKQAKNFPRVKKIFTMTLIAPTSHQETELKSSKNSIHSAEGMQAQFQIHRSSLKENNLNAATYSPRIHQ